MPDPAGRARRRRDGHLTRCASKWVNRWRRHGEVGLRDRASTPHHSPNATPGLGHPTARLGGASANGQLSALPTSSPTLGSTVNRRIAQVPARSGRSGDRSTGWNSESPEERAHPQVNGRRRQPDRRPWKMRQRVHAARER
ncbi:leucine zipper domain-containing protein [Pseudonocardia alni]|uniref:leucine zipper domain-containing protein n=1 Tax=Pseudonocardia alni TaxID=33907 RepID=UPI0035710AB0